jgi:hypothetical protein
VEKYHNSLVTEREYNVWTMNNVQILAKFYIKILVIK